ncbi:MAG: hypothetical protein ACYS76_11140 [Planctomycetota bacterium]|jgi:hypothetical protein
MDQTYPTRKYEADKIALLGLFAGGLLIAYLITSARYTGPRKAGTELVAEVKRKGISAFLDRLGRRSFFLIRNAAGRPIGFTMDTFTDSPSDPKFTIQSAGLLYIKGRYGQEQVMSFQSNDRLDQFAWKSEVAGPTGRSGTEIVLGEDGVLTVTELTPEQKTQSSRPGPASIPNFLLDLVFTQLLETGHKKVIVDTIDTDGRIVEVAISKTQNTASRASQNQAAYKLSADSLDQRPFSQQVYFDDQGRISKILLQHDGVYLFERTSVESILDKFPERADYLLHKSGLWQQYQP